MSAFDGQMDLLATLIASTAEFQSTTSASTVALAKDRIGYHESADEENPIKYPRATIADGGVIERVKTSTGSWRGTGSLFLSFEFPAPTNKVTVEQQREWFLTKVSTIMRQAEVIGDSRATPTGYSTSHLMIRSYRRLNGPFALQPSERDLPEDTDSPLRPLWAIEFEVEY